MHAVTFQTVLIVISSSVQSLIFAVKEKKMEERGIGNWEWGMTNVGNGEYLKATMFNMRILF